MEAKEKALWERINKLTSYIMQLEARNKELEGWLRRLQSVRYDNYVGWDKFCRDLGLDSTLYNKGDQNGID